MRTKALVFWFCHYALSLGCFCTRTSFRILDCPRHYWAPVCRMYIVRCVNKKKSDVMVIGSKWQLKSLKLYDFKISVNSDKLLLAKQAKYLGLWVRNDLSWDDHILELCRKMYYYFHMFRRLRKILPSALLLNIYKTYVQSKIDYGLSIWGCTTEVNVQRIVSCTTNPEFACKNHM